MSATPSSYHVVENLIVTYAELVDDGDFTGLANLLADATLTGSGEPVSGRDDIEQFFRDTLIVYDDGTPKLDHRDGTWRFVARRVRIDLVGDVSRHLRNPAAAPDRPSTPGAGLHFRSQRH